MTKKIQKLDEEIGVDSSDLELENSEFQVSKIDDESTNVVASEGENGERDENLQQDYHHARNTMKNLVTDGQQVLSHLLEEIQEGGTPRHYEVASSLMKNVSEISKDLIDLQKQMNEIENKTSDAPGTVNNIQHNYNYKTTQEIIDEIKEENDDNGTKE